MPKRICSYCGQEMKLNEVLAKDPVTELDTVKFEQFCTCPRGMKRRGK